MIAKDERYIPDKGYIENKMDDFVGEEDSRELRIQLKLPITKELVYYYSKGYSEKGKVWAIYKVTGYKIVYNYLSGSKTLLILLDNGQGVYIHSDYFAHMQKPSFVKDMAEGKE